MLDIIIFAKKWGFILDKDILELERKDFNINNYKKIHNKPFICYNDNETQIICGKIVVLSDIIDEEEWYYIEKEEYFRMDIKEIDENKIIMEYKKYQLLPR